MNDTREVFSRRFRKLAEELREKQVDIANFLNVTEATVSRYFKGRIPHDYEMLKKIARHYNVSVDYLLGNTDVREVVAVHEAQTGYGAPGARLAPDLEEIVVLLHEYGHRLTSKERRTIKLIIEEEADEKRRGGERRERAKEA